LTVLVLATRNTKKLAELRRILDEGGLDVELAGPEVFAEVPDIAETGETFAENAMLKARAVAQATGLPAVADDSGLCVDALNGMPGILSARWAGKHGDDEANLDLVLGQLADVPDERRGAHFACAAALALPTGEGEVVTGEIHGTLLRERRGEHGFGYDPIFRPDGYEITTAEMDSAEKDAISHRGKALRALVPHLAACLGGSSSPPR
jgi:XTP/dITP diphosphohydrolase